MAWPSPGVGRFHGILLVSLTGPTGLGSGGGTHAATVQTAAAEIIQTSIRSMTGN